MSAAENTSPTFHIAYIGLGSNIEPEENLPRALAALRKQVKLLCISSAWHAPAQGTTGPDFLNASAKLETEYTAEELKDRVLRPVEEMLGRHRSPNKNAPRTIDLDILIFDDEILDAHIWDYAHLAIPVAECFPELIHPVSNQSIAQIAFSLRKSANIKQSPLSLTNIGYNQVTN